MPPTERGPYYELNRYYAQPGRAADVLDTRRREICLASAGQTPPIHWPAGGEPRYVRLTGLPLGARSTSSTRSR